MNKISLKMETIFLNLLVIILCIVRLKINNKVISFTIFNLLKKHPIKIKKTKNNKIYHQMFIIFYHYYLVKIIILEPCNQ